MHFLGNLSSVHLSTWFSLYQQANLPYKGLYSVHPLVGEHSNAKKIYILSKIVSYILLGIYLLFKLPSKSILHAHGASGYGLSALISRKRFVVTVYGSEVFASHNYFYNLMMKLVFTRASVITVTSTAAKQKIMTQFGINEEKISLFHTGINTMLLSDNRKSSPLWKNDSSLKCLSMRNTAPHYQTKTVIQSFLNASIQNQLGEKPQLIVILGNGDKDYFNKLKSDYDSEYIMFIDELLKPSEIHALINDSDICINFPKTDQLSATLLEAIFYGKKVICSDVPAYQEFFSLCKQTGIQPTIASPDALEKTLIDVMSSTSPATDIGSTLIEQHYSQTSAANFFKQSMSKHFGELS